MFGSYPHGSERGESDIDLAFWGEQKHSSYNLFLISQQLADLIEVEVNLIDLRDASYVLQTHIFSNGTVIYSENEQLRMKLQMDACSRYAFVNCEEGSIKYCFDERRTYDER